MTSVAKHLDEARRNAIAAMRALLRAEPTIARAVLLDDLFGRLHVVLWRADGDGAEAIKERFAASLCNAAERFWSGDIQVATPRAGHADQLLFESIWNDGRPDREVQTLRIADRHRSRGGWLSPFGEPPWPETAAPPIIAFYSFKGGVGRTTALAAFAITRAREEGERIVVIDFDLDAPGVGTLLAADEQGTIAGWGVVDYLLERQHRKIDLADFDLADYYHACRRQKITGSGEILVFPAGCVNADFLGKLARVDFEPPQQASVQGLPALLEQVRKDLAPDWILIDCRAGLGEPAGLVLGGMAHLHVLFGTTSEQSWQGLGIVIDRLGAERVRAGLPQAACLLVHAMVPIEQRDSAEAAFSDRADEEFRARYYAKARKREEADQEDRLLVVEDMGTSGTPHVPLPIRYSPTLAHFRSIDDVANDLATSHDHAVLSKAIVERSSIRPTEETNESPDAG